jgi:hypothetical protein
MKLSELEPTFLVIVDEKTMRHTDDIQGADGVMFLCPKCYGHNAGPVGTHQVLCWQPHVPQSRDPKPGRWRLVGTGYADLTLVAGSSSILLMSWCVRPGCPNWHGWPEGGGPPCADPRCAGWHGFVQGGQIL